MESPKDKYHKYLSAYFDHASGTDTDVRPQEPSKLEVAVYEADDSLESSGSHFEGDFN
ncbi:MAG TPA: hypothetical protein VJG30_03775 [Candidatus Nanoarchaeia archaeon]|nr:hypothetical protein [Candidatus Nanoarchaeia archaeon]